MSQAKTERHLLIVARSAPLREDLATRLRDAGFRVHVARSAGEVVQVVREMPLSAVLVESMAGTEAERFRKQIQRLRPECRIIFLASFDHARETGQLLLHGPKSFILGEDELTALLEGAGDTGARPTGEIAADLKTRSLIQTLDSVVSLIEADDHYFGGFAHRVASLAAEVAVELGLTGDAADEIVIAALLRDLGKSGIDRRILDESGVYGTSDMVQMQEHVVWSLRLLEHIEFPWKILPIIRHHHERYDGSGYPDSLRGRQIPIGARILAAVETWVAMVSDRPHRPAKGPEEARAELMAVAGSQLDPEVVEILTRLVDARVGVHGSDGTPLVAIADTDHAYARLLRVRLLNEGLDAVVRGSPNERNPAHEGRPPSLVVCEIGGEPAEALDRIRDVRRMLGSERTPIAVLSRTDDRKLRMACLREGIDDFIPKDNDLEEVVARIRNVLVREAKRKPEPAARRPDGILGRIETMPLTDVAQFLIMGAKTACVTLSTDNVRGAIWFVQGKIVHASCADQTGAEAFFRLLRWTSGEFLINHGVTTEESTIAGDGMGLLMEGLRLQDEEKRGATLDATELTWET